jgi:predicted TIM-barrel fold metal-dependent hydrolase
MDGGKWRLVFGVMLLAGGFLEAKDPIRLSALNPIDAHVHFFVNSPALGETLDRLNFHFINITVLDPYTGGYETMTPQHQICAELARATGGRAAWVSSFDPRGLEDPDFASSTIALLKETFRQGAVGVKIYKTIGMELRKKSGEYAMPDDSAFDPILNAIAASGKTLYAHIAEPDSAWRPLDPADPNYSYYKNNPQWHMYGHPDRPSKAAILEARDRMLARHQDLRVVGCHLGSLEEDVDELARRLDRYPNFVVDTAGRVSNLALQPRKKVRAFLLKYQDRALYGTDDFLLPGQDVAASLARWTADLEKDWKFLSPAQTVDYFGRKVQGLALPESVLRKIFRENALRWVPGIVPVKTDSAGKNKE